MEHFPVRVRLSVRMIIMCIVFTLILLLIVYGCIVINTQTIYMEDDLPMPLPFKVFMNAVLIVVGAGMLFMDISMWKRIFTRAGAMTLTENGVENTFVIFAVMAFWTTLHIRFIPWSALQFDESKEGYTIDTAQMPPGSVSKIVRMLLKFTGFSCHIGKIKKEEFEHYRCAAVLQNNM